ncbi:GyrI-like domain-containing protein [Gordonia sp. PDNC005]|uniref:GyrI-like domain-containing protein n=1 Tax=unclassified Gordonia (in: high G+C Gram-positive bacteria) TaxID=2657482 RepID=UPI001964E3AF|nr:GyrI-like domain-containing protein [Gordonia sp. PDNC005]QRY63664.1 GyrI-like domain-containing protein [Gordonia sp. PDNC005]
MTDKIDFKKVLDSYRAARGRFDIVDVPDMQYLMVDGHGDPNTAVEYTDALAALYPVAFKLKFASRRELGRDYVVPPLEGLWWAADMDAFTTSRDKAKWDWTMMIMVPDWIDHSIFVDAVAQVGAKDPPVRLPDVRLRPLTEGRCLQTLHIGPYDDEAQVLDRLHNEFIPQNGLHLNGLHHEIYLSDARRVAPEKLRTILRQPIAPA